MSDSRNIAAEKKDLSDIFAAVTARGEKLPFIEDGVTQHILDSVQVSQFPNFRMMVDFNNTPGSVVQNEDGSLEYVGKMTPAVLGAVARNLRRGLH